MSSFDSVRAVEWYDDCLVLLDQRRLPDEVHFLRVTTEQQAAEAIRDMVVRGAPAIGIAAAYAMVLAAQRLQAGSDDQWLSGLGEAAETLAASRPTAVNLRWALSRMFHRAKSGAPGDVVGLLAEAERILAEDLTANKRMGAHGAQLISPGSNVLTHCNTGSLATAGFGTALGVIRAAYAERRIGQVFATESRPWLQGARLTAWELSRDGIPVNLIVDSAAAYLMARGEIQWVAVGADRITANGDVANKIGTYSLAVAAARHKIPFMVVAPLSTIDMGLESGNDIPIEFRGPEEILPRLSESQAELVTVVNPAFDVTPAELITALVTEQGVVHRPTAGGIRRLYTDSH
ncbi:MAG: S-methyl-5-thioribose-1-phosphate isomerase [Pseudomonadota bacterium]|nr:S-methyl-5-thioribose-1-phosphate isomerase [Pseudomonadota bacterium]